MIKSGYRHQFVFKRTSHSGRGSQSSSSGGSLYRSIGMSRLVASERSLMTAVMPGASRNMVPRIWLSEILIPLFVLTQKVGQTCLPVAAARQESQGNPPKADRCFFRGSRNSYRTTGAYHSLVIVIFSSDVRSLHV